MRAGLGALLLLCVAAGTQADVTAARIWPARDYTRVTFEWRGGVTVVGGHAVMAVGYDDAKKIKNSSPGGIEYTGALLIRNSWGIGWGDGGYGWLPYEYVLRGLAVDWWSLIKKEWVNTQNFGLG